MRQRADRRPLIEQLRSDPLHDPVGAVLGDFGKYGLYVVGRRYFGGPQRNSKRVGRSFIGLDLALLVQICAINQRRNTQPHELNPRGSFIRRMSKRAVHSSEQPSKTERDCYGRIRLIFDGVAQRFLKGTGSLPRGFCGRVGNLGGAVNRLAVKVLGGVRYFAGDASSLFLGISKSVVEITAGITGLWHIHAPLEWG
jgi:hypothetical protein